MDLELGSVVRCISGTGSQSVFHLPCFMDSQLLWPRHPTEQGCYVPGSLNLEFQEKLFSFSSVTQGQTNPRVETLTITSGATKYSAYKTTQLLFFFKVFIPTKRLAPTCCSKNTELTGTITITKQHADNVTLDSTKITCYLLDLLKASRHINTSNFKIIQVPLKYDGCTKY